MNFDTWGIISAAVLASVLSYVLLFRHRLGRRLRFSGLQLFTGGLYGAILILLMPIMHDAEVWQDLPVLPWLRALLLSVPEAVRFFLLEGDFVVVEGALSADGTPASLAFRVYGTCLYFLAPMMTFGNVLSLFSGTIARLRLCFSIRPVAAFSALNEASLTLAESIYREKRKQILGRPLIAFVGVSGEQDDELRRRVREFGGIILKHDPVRLAISVFNRPIEFFLLSEQEENVELGLRLAKRYKEGKRKVSVFVFASSENADMLLDNSAKSERVLGKAFRDKILNFPQEILYQNALKAENCEIYGTSPCGAWLLPGRGRWRC